MLSISLPSNIEQQVNQVAQQTGCSVSDFIHEAILNHLSKKEANNTIKENAFEDFVAMITSRELDPTFVDAVEEIHKDAKQERVYG